MDESERKILEIVNSKLLITEGELSAALEKVCINNGSDTFQKLRDDGLIERVHSLGTCIVITQKGMRALKKR